MDFEHEVRQMRSLLSEQADAKRAAGEKAYLKSSQQFYGVDVPKLRKIAKDWQKNHKTVEVDEVVAFTAHLWDSDWHEERSLATIILQQYSARLSPVHLPAIERMMNETSGWVHLDNLATGVISVMIERHPVILKDLPRWAQSENFWVRRAAILAQVIQFRRGEGDFELFERLVVPMFDEGKHWSKEERFFIRKAIGWTLREMAPANPEGVFSFVQRHKSKMSGLTYREATRKLPADYQARLDS